MDDDTSAPRDENTADRSWLVPRRLPVGFAPAQPILDKRVELSLPDQATTVTLSIEPTGTAHFVTEAAVPANAACADVLEIDVEVTLSTADGAFNEHFADKLLVDDPFALLVGFALDQQVTVMKAFAGPLVLKERRTDVSAMTITTFSGSGKLCHSSERQSRYSKWSFFPQALANWSMMPQLTPT